MKRNDTLWKGIIEDLFDDLLRFLYEKADDKFDFSKGFEFLDKELEDLFPKIDQEKVRYVDKLVKVYHREKGEQWMLFHIEVQGYNDPEFRERMFTYYYRIRDKYQRKVTAWAFFTDANKNFHPNQYEDSFLGTCIKYRFNTLKILDQNEGELKNSSNPFSAVIHTVLLALKRKQVDEGELLNLKLELARNLLNKGFKKQKIRALMNFLRFYVRLNLDKSVIFEKQLETITGKSYPMGIEELILEQERKAGEKRGEKRGEIKGKTEVVLASFDDGLKVPQIARITNLPEKVVEKILKDHGKME
jgi:predicted transposase YdaD